MFVVKINEIFGYNFKEMVVVGEVLFGEFFFMFRILLFVIYSDGFIW